MTPAVRVEEAPKKMPWDVRCRECGGWIATVSGAASWLRARCINRRCALYGEPQEMRRANN